jgi:FkbM family methyltransferase
MKQAIKRAACGGMRLLLRKPRVVPTLLGFKMLLDPEDFSGLRMATGTYERADVALYRKLSLLPGVVVDVGANIGFFSLLFAKTFPGVTVHAFEPNPFAADRLRGNIAANRLEEIIAVHEVAVGSGPATVELSCYPGIRGHAWARVGVQASDGMRTLHVPQVALDEVFENSTIPVRLIKIDVEGYEAEVLAGMRRLVSHWKPVVVFEVSLSFLIEKPGAYQQELAFAREFGYQLMIADGQGLQPYTWPSARVFNLWLMPPDLPAPHLRSANIAEQQPCGARPN